MSPASENQREKTNSTEYDEDNCIRRPTCKIGQHKETKLSQTSARSSDWDPTDTQMHDIVSRAIKKIKEVSSPKKQHEPSVTIDSEDKESFVCHMPNCRRNFSKAESLKKHLVWHPGKINFSCSQCKKGFERKDTFLRHVQSHASAKQKNTKVKKVTRKRRAATAKINDVPQLACSIEGCAKVYHSIKLLDAHIKYKHSVETHTCTWPSCGKKFTRNYGLRRHATTHSTDAERTCPHCNKQYRYKRSLNKHILSRHEDDEDVN